MNLISVYKYPGAFTILYDWLKERSTEDDDFVNISHRRLPSFQAHVSFVQSHPYRIWEFILSEDYPVGYISATETNTVGIILGKKYRGYGLGPDALQLFLATHGPLPPIKSNRTAGWVANINPRNERSIAVFGKVGFKHIQNTYVLNPEEGTDGTEETKAS